MQTSFIKIALEWACFEEESLNFYYQAIENKRDVI